MDPALALFTQAIALRDAPPKLLEVSDRIYRNRSAALLGLGRFENALVDADRGVACEPTDAYAHYARGLALHYMSRAGAHMHSTSRPMEP